MGRRSAHRLRGLIVAVLPLLDAAVAAQEPASASRLPEHYQARLLEIGTAPAGELPVIQERGAILLRRDPEGERTWTEVERQGDLEEFPRVGIAAQSARGARLPLNPSLPRLDPGRNEARDSDPLVLSLVHHRARSRWAGATVVMDPAGAILARGRFHRREGPARRGVSFLVVHPAVDPQDVRRVWTADEHARRLAALYEELPERDPLTLQVLDLLARLPLKRLLSEEQRASLIGSIRARSTVRLEDLARLWRHITDQEQAAVPRRLTDPAGDVLFLAGDEALFARWQRSRSWTRERGRVLALGFAQETDPLRRGEIAWLAIAPREEGRMMSLVLPLARALRDGTAVLPGNSGERAHRERIVFTLEAETRIGAPLAMLGAGAGGLFLVVCLLRAAGRRAIF